MRKVWISGSEASLVFQAGSGEWKCCEWQRSVSLTQSRHASPSHRLAQKWRVMVADKRKRKTEKCASFRLLLNNRRKSRLSCMCVCVWVCVRSVASSELSYFLDLFCGSVQLACCLLSSPHRFFLYRSWMLHVCKLTKMFLFAFIQVQHVTLLSPRLDVESVKAICYFIMGCVWVAFVWK